MKKTFQISDASLRYFHALVELQDAFKDFARPRFWRGFRSPNELSEFARIVAAARTDFWTAVFNENPSARNQSACASLDGIVTWDDKEDKP